MLVRDAVDLLAWHVFERADRAQQPVTLAAIERRIDELLGHAPTCRCRLHKAAATITKPIDVYRTARNWQQAIAATRVRAAR